MKELTVQEFHSRLDSAEMVRNHNRAAEQARLERAATRPVRGEDLKVGMIVVRGEGRDRTKTILTEFVKYGTACGGNHFRDQHRAVGCYDRCAWNEVVAE